MSEAIYSIGVQGQPWSDKEKDLWFEGQSIKRSYQEEVL